MKRLTAVLLMVLLLCGIFCLAEGSAVDEKAKETISMVNYFAKEYSGVDQLFIGYQEVVADEIYGFYANCADLQALLVADSETNAIDNCSFITDTPEDMALALNCCSIMPFAAMLEATDEETAAAVQADMMAMAGWIDENSADAMEAFTSGGTYQLSYQESEFFHVSLVIVPMEEGSRMMASYYFGPAEQAA